MVLHWSSFYESIRSLEPLFNSNCLDDDLRGDLRRKFPEYFDDGGFTTFSWYDLTTVRKVWAMVTFMHHFLIPYFIAVCTIYFVVRLSVATIYFTQYLRCSGHYYTLVVQSYNIQRHRVKIWAPARSLLQSKQKAPQTHASGTGTNSYAWLTWLMLHLLCI